MIKSFSILLKNPAFPKTSVQFPLNNTQNLSLLNYLFLMHLFSQTASPTNENTKPLNSGFDFVKTVLEDSIERLVIVDFWAPWCGPCKQLSPILERTIAAAGPSIALVKINIDDNPEIAAQLRVQSIPAVFAFFNGQPIDGFMGALPESQVKAFIERAIKRAGAGSGRGNTEDLLDDASTALIDNDIPTALDLYSQVLALQPQSASAAAGIARCYLARGDHVRASSILESLSPEAKEDPAIQSAQTAIDLTEKGKALAGNQADLDQRLETSSTDVAAYYDRALIYFSNGHPGAAIDDLLAIIRYDQSWNEAAGRTTLLHIFDALGPKHPLTTVGRRKLSALLFS